MIQPLADPKVGLTFNCQICENDQKLHGGLMVHHGYTRPGIGYIQGDCYGVAMVPYEVSCDAIKAWKVSLEANLVGQKARLARLQNGEVKSFTELEWAGHRQPKKMVTYDVATTEKYKWAELLRKHIWEAKINIGATEYMIARCARRITEWTAKPVRTVEEEKAKMDMAKSERAALVAEKRAAKAAKQAATKAKQADLEARRQTIKDDFIARFKALAESPESPERKAAAVAVAYEMKKAKYRFFWVRELGVDDTIIALGLAVRDDGNPLWVKYAGCFS